MRLAVTGANGFIGKALMAELMSNNYAVNAVVRSTNSGALDSAQTFAVGSIGSDTNFADALVGVDGLIHCAARVHIVKTNDAAALAAYREVNVRGTRRLAEQAVASGVRRFIYLSSIKVNGEQTDRALHFTHRDKAMPTDPYGLSKWEAEQVLHEVAAKTGLEVVIIRLPLVYGIEVKGNFLSMLDWLTRGVPLPLGAVNNRRSLLGVDNLVDLIMTCTHHPSAVNQTFLVSDDQDISTTDLLRTLAAALNKPARLLPVPTTLLALSAQLMRKQPIAQRLLGSLRVDISHTKETLAWAPPVGIEEGLQKTAKWYLSRP